MSVPLTLHCLAGILMPSSGEVHFNGMRLDRLGDDSAVRCGVAEP